MIETHMVAYRAKSFDAEVTERNVVYPHAEDVTALVLHIHTHPDEENHGIPEDVITVTTTVAQARRIRDAYDYFLSRHDGI